MAIDWLKFFRGEPKSTASVAKERLKVVVAHQRDGRSNGPDYLPKLREEILAVVRKYVQIPDNAYATYTLYGPGWDCARGFQLSAQTCARVNIPANAFLSRSGHTWECERGFRREQSTCTPVPVPQNAHLDYAGDSWKCDRGFHAHGSACAAD